MVRASLGLARGEMMGTRSEGWRYDLFRAYIRFCETGRILPANVRGCQRFSHPAQNYIDNPRNRATAKTIFLGYVVLCRVIILSTGSEKTHHDGHPVQVSGSNPPLFVPLHPLDSTPTTQRIRLIPPRPPSDNGNTHAQGQHTSCRQQGRGQNLPRKACFQNRWYGTSPCSGQCSFCARVNSH